MGPFLLTGGTGFVGNTVLKRLQQEFLDEPITVISRRSFGSNGLVRWFKTDLANEADILRCAQGVRTIIHCAAQISGISENKFNLTNVRGTENLAKAALATGAERFIYISSSGVYGPPDFNGPRDENAPLKPLGPYATSKLAAENKARDILGDSVALSILRPTGLYGPGREIYRRLLNRLTKQKLYWIYKGDEIVHPTHIDDLLHCIFSLVIAPLPHRGIFNVSGERTIALEELYDMLCELAGIQRTKILLPGFIAHPLIELLKRIGKLDQLAARVAHQKAQGLFPSSETDSCKAKSVLGLLCYSFDSGLKAMVESFNTDIPGHRTN